MGGYGADYSYETDDVVVKKSAKQYNIKAKRDYKIKEIKAKLPPPLDKVIITKAEFPIVIAVDVTGSMRTLPGLIFEKLCILYNEILYFMPKSLKKSFEISFAAIGDAYTDAYPIQITDFAKGKDLDNNIKSLYPEGGGGGQARETYELLAYYYLNKCKMPNTLNKPRPIFIYIGDEGYYNRVNRAHIKEYIGSPPETDLISTEVFEDLRKIFDVYMLRIEYRDAEEEKNIHEKWQEALGRERVIKLAEPKRVVDTILGIVAASLDQFNGFKERIEIRQTPEQVKEVYSTLHGLRMEEKSYVYNFQILTCPACGGILEKVPEHNAPEKCPYCKVHFVRI
jgi:hypothetical protein